MMRHRQGGLAIGLALIIVDLILNNAKGYGGGKGKEVPTDKDNVSIKNCALRIVLWPGERSSLDRIQSC